MNYFESFTYFCVTRVSTKSITICCCYTSFVIMLSNIAINGDIVGLHSPSCGQLVAHVLADDSFMFKKPQKKISKGVCKL